MRLRTSPAKIADRAAVIQGASNCTAKEAVDMAMHLEFEALLRFDEERGITVGKVDDVTGRHDSRYYASIYVYHDS
jgi:hypothetical protein